MKNFLKNESGSFAINLALIGGVMIFCLAAGIDITLWQAQQNKLQDAADSGALSGAIMLGNGGRDVASHSEKQASEFAQEANDTTLPGFQSGAVINALEETVEVTLSAEVPRIFSHIIKNGEQRVVAVSKAKVVRDSFYCIYALNTTASGAINGNGNALLQGLDCSIQVNSIAPDAIKNTGTITADNICVAGGAAGAGYTPAPSTGCPIVTDPMADIFIPSAGLCDFTDYRTTSSATLSPGTYCGGIKVSGLGTSVSLQPGEYHIVDGDMKVSGSGSITGDEVVFILSGTASMDISGSGLVSTTPPIFGPLEGFSIVQHRSSPLGYVSKITGEGQFEFPGIIYLPNQALEIAGRAEGNSFTPSYAAIIVNTLKISGNGELLATADSSNFSQAASSKLANVGARLVQ